MRRLRVGVIGLGVGSAHASAYMKASSAELVAVADRNQRLLERFSGSAVRTYESAETMLAEEDLDGVSICTPPRTHAHLAILALESGINVLCEKPMATTLDECDTMIGAAAREDLKLMIAFKKRFHPSYLKLRQIFCDGVMAPYMLHFTYVCTGGVTKPWFWEEGNGGGPLVENTVHAVDILRYLLGDVSRVYAEGDNYVAKDSGIRQVDSAVLALRFRNGSIAGLTAGAWARGPLKGERLVAYSKTGIAEISGGFDRPDLLKIHLYGKKEVDTHHSDHVNLFEREVENFLESILKDKAPAATGSDGREALRVCLAAKESARKGVPISLGSRNVA